MHMKLNLLYLDAVDTMEFPDDILVLIRAYAKPLFRFSREYKEALRKLGMAKWPQLKQKLYTPHADQIMDALNAYVNAYTLGKQVYNEHDRLRYTWPETKDIESLRLYWEKVDQMIQTRRSTQILQNLRYNELIALMYNLA